MKSLLLALLLAVVALTAATPAASATPAPPPLCSDVASICSETVDPAVRSAYEAARAALCQTPFCPM